MSKRTILQQRTITGILFGITVMALVFSGRFGAIMLGLLASVMSQLEYMRMVVADQTPRHWFGYFINAGIFSLMVLLPPTDTAYVVVAMISVACMLAGIVNLYIPFIPHRRAYWLVSIAYFGLPFGLFFSHVWNTTQYAPSFWCMILALIWMSDSFAYLVGSAIGRHKLMPSVSPGKTWEGFLGAGILTAGITWWASSVFTPVIPGVLSTPVTWTLIAAIIWCFGTLGDLVESSVKRAFGKKDSGRLLPGHGGILDRFDSFIYILPFVLFLLTFLI